jgi:hypothetical protein
MGRKSNAQKESEIKIAGGNTSSQELDEFKSSLGVNDAESKRAARAEKKLAAQKANDEAIDALCNPEILGNILCTHMDARYASTGLEFFQVSDENRISLGVQARTCLKAFDILKDDPKWYALGMLGYTFLRMTIESEVRFSLYKKKLKKDNPKKEPENGNTAGK